MVFLRYLDFFNWTHMLFGYVGTFLFSLTRNFALTSSFFLILKLPSQSGLQIIQAIACIALEYLLYLFIYYSKKSSYSLYLDINLGILNYFMKNGGILLIFVLSITNLPTVDMNQFFQLASFVHFVLVSSKSVLSSDDWYRTDYVRIDAIVGVI